MASMKTLLIIDENLVDRASYCRYLQQDSEHTYLFLEAETGKEGLELCQPNRPDAVLLDYQLQKQASQQPTVKSGACKSPS